MSRDDLLRGKGFYIYRFELFDGSPSDLVRRAADLGANWLAPRVVGWQSIDQQTEPYMSEFIEACQVHNIRWGGWGYHVGLDWLNRQIAKPEAEAASEAINRFRLDFYVLNAEREYKGNFRPYSWWRWRPADAMKLAMLTFWKHFRELQPEICAGMTSYRYPNIHHEFVWDEALDPRYCDFSQPQVYALGDQRTQGPAMQLAECFRQYDALAGEQLPMSPLMATYPHGSWRQTAAQTRAFAEKARELNLLSYGAYTFEHATEAQRSAFAESWSPEVDRPELVPFNNLPESQRWGIVERALREHGFVDQDGNVRADSIG